VNHAEKNIAIAGIAGCRIGIGFKMPRGAGLIATIMSFGQGSKPELQSFEISPGSCRL